MDQAGHYLNSFRRLADPLTALTFYLSASVVFRALSRPARCLADSTSLEQANKALHTMGIKTELDLERERYQIDRRYDVE